MFDIFRYLVLWRRDTSASSTTSLSSSLEVSKPDTGDTTLLWTVGFEMVLLLVLAPSWALFVVDVDVDVKALVVAKLVSWTTAFGFSAIFEFDGLLLLVDVDGTSFTDID